MKILFRVALFCGIIPLLIGIAIFIAWAFSRAGWLAYAGLVTFYVGAGALAIGTLCLAIYVWNSWQNQSVSHRKLLLRALAVCGLYLFNFIAAGGVLIGMIILQSLYTVTVMNKSNASLNDTRIVCDTYKTGKTDEIKLGDIAPGETISRTFWPNEGLIALKGIHASREIKINVADVSDIGGKTMVILDSQGNLTKKHLLEE